MQSSGSPAPFSPHGGSQGGNLTPRPPYGGSGGPTQSGGAQGTPMAPGGPQMTPGRMTPQRPGMI